VKAAVNDAAANTVTSPETDCAAVSLVAGAAVVSAAAVVAGASVGATLTADVVAVVVRRVVGGVVGVGPARGADQTQDGHHRKKQSTSSAHLSRLVNYKTNLIASAIDDAPRRNRNEESVPIVRYGSLCG
jgi:hypothetical protein